MVASASSIAGNALLAIRDADLTAWDRVVILLRGASAVRDQMNAFLAGAEVIVRVPRRVDVEPLMAGHGHKTVWGAYDRTFSRTRQTASEPKRTVENLPAARTRASTTSPGGKDRATARMIEFAYAQAIVDLHDAVAPKDENASRVAMDAVRDAFDIERAAKIALGFQEMQFYFDKLAHLAFQSALTTATKDAFDAISAPSQRMQFYHYMMDLLLESPSVREGIKAGSLSGTIFEPSVGLTLLDTFELSVVANGPVSSGAKTVVLTLKGKSRPQLDALALTWKATLEALTALTIAVSADENASTPQTVLQPLINQYKNLAVPVGVRNSASLALSNAQNLAGVVAAFEKAIKPTASGADMYGAFKAVFDTTKGVMEARENALKAAYKNLDDEVASKELKEQLSDTSAKALRRVTILLGVIDTAIAARAALNARTHAEFRANVAAGVGAVLGIAAILVAGPTGPLAAVFVALIALGDLLLGAVKRRFEQDAERERMTRIAAFTPFAKLPTPQIELSAALADPTSYVEPPSRPGLRDILIPPNCDVPVVHPAFGFYKADGTRDVYRQLAVLRAMSAGPGFAVATNNRLDTIAFQTLRKTVALKSDSDAAGKDTSLPNNTSVRAYDVSASQDEAAIHHDDVVAKGTQALKDRLPTAPALITSGNPNGRGMVPQPIFFAKRDSSSEMDWIGRDIAGTISAARDRDVSIKPLSGSDRTYNLPLEWEFATELPQPAISNTARAPFASPGLEKLTYVERSRLEQGFIDDFLQWLGS